jgi:hypothetical protein
MFAIPGLLLLVFVEYMRPQVHYPVLQSLQLLHSAVAMTAAGLVVDLRLALSSLRPAPHLTFALLFFAWNLVTVGVKAPVTFPSRAATLLIPLAFYLLTAHAIQTFRMLEVLCALLLGISIVLSAFGIHQGFAPLACHRVIPVQGEPTWVFDDRPCEDRFDCERDGDPGMQYTCERAGVFGTSTIGGRVRWMGTMEDPNELSLALGITIPFAFAFFDRRRTTARLLLLLLTAVTAGLCAVLTGSRGGQLVFVSVIGVYFVRQVGAVRGGLVGLLLALPLLLFGGRTGGGAEESTEERTFLWWYGLHLFTGSPVVGVGSGQFMEYHHQTAHNAFVLTLAELGFQGLLLLVAILWIAVKIPLTILRRHGTPPVARTWSLAILASLVGMLVGITFLSFTYKNSLWLFIGLTGVLFHAVKRHDPGFEIPFRAREAAMVVLLCVALVVVHVGYTGSKLGW